MCPKDIKNVTADSAEVHPKDIKNAKADKTVESAPQNDAEAHSKDIKNAPGRDLEAAEPVNFSILAMHNRPSHFTERGKGGKGSIPFVSDDTSRVISGDDDDHMSCLLACIVERSLFKVGVFDGIVVMDSTSQDNEKRAVVAWQREIQSFQRQFVVKGSLLCVIFVVVILILIFVADSRINSGIEEEET